MIKLFQLNYKTKTFILNIEFIKVIANYYNDILVPFDESM